MEREPPSRPPADDDLVRREEQAAAAEARSIGGHGSNEDADPSQRPLREAGEGQAEGFEDTERELIEHASHGDPAPYPPDMAGRPEDPRAADAEYGEADEEQSSELDEDRPPPKDSPGA